MITLSSALNKFVKNHAFIFLLRGESQMFRSLNPLKKMVTKEFYTNGSMHCVKTAKKVSYFSPI